MEERDPRLRHLDALVGTWRMEMSLPDVPDGEVVFEWVLGGRFLAQRWGIPRPPDGEGDVSFGGLAILGPDPRGLGYLQHYFDTRGVARMYRMSLEGGVWRLWRDAPDVSDLDFHQRFAGTLAEDGRVIEGRWEISHDAGATWETDFDMVYTKMA